MQGVVSFLRRDAPVLVLASPKLLPSFFLQEYLSSGVNNKLDVEMHATGFITSFVSILSNTLWFLFVSSIHELICFLAILCS